MFVSKTICKLIVFSIFCLSCTPDRASRDHIGELESSSKEAVTILKSEYVELKNRPPVLVTGNETLRFESGPCFKLAGLQALGPSYINLMHLVCRC